VDLLWADYARCVELVERAQQRWAPRTDQQYQLNRLLHDVLVAWGETELYENHFRAAFEHAEAAMRVPSPYSATAEALRAEPLRLGTIRAAVLPVVGRARVDAGFVRQVNDVLALEYWLHPAPFIGLVSSSDVSRAITGQGLAGRELDVQTAATVADQPNARYAVSAILDDIEYSKSSVRRQGHLALPRRHARQRFITKPSDLACLGKRVGTHEHVSVQRERGRKDDFVRLSTYGTTRRDTCGHIFLAASFDFGVVRTPEGSRQPFGPSRKEKG